VVGGNALIPFIINEAIKKQGSSAR
jgi:hypothetical protein